MREEVEAKKTRRNRGSTPRGKHHRQKILLAQMEPYRSLQPNAGLLLPETERVPARVIVLPTGQTLDEETVARVCEVIRNAAQ